MVGNRPVSAASNAQAGAVVGGKFRLEQRLGEGGMGIVWEASNVRTHRTVALKILKAETPDQRRRLFREGRIAGKLRHPNIVEVNDVVELEDGAPAIVMERLTGESLRALLLRETRLPLPRIAEIFRPIAEALACAHAQGVVHRDLKPENVFLARDRDAREQVKVLDFGIARLTATAGDMAPTHGLTDTGDVLGTPSYMAPEQVFGEKDVDTRADVWSYGVVLYECLTGEKPFTGDNFGQIFKQVAIGEITPVAERVPDLPAELGAMVMQMLARDRTQRPSDWGAVIAVLERGQDARRPAPRPRRRRLLVLGLALASALTGGGLLAHRLRSPPPPMAVAADAAAPEPAPEVTPAAPSPAARPSSSVTVAPSTTVPVRPQPPPRPVASAADPVLPGGVHGKSPY